MEDGQCEGIYDIKSVYNDSMSFRESYTRVGALTLVEIDENIWEVVLANMAAMDWSVRQQRKHSG